jgi:hypothetical protein
MFVYYQWGSMSIEYMLFYEENNTIYCKHYVTSRRLHRMWFYIEKFIESDLFWGVFICYLNSINRIQFT